MINKETIMENDIQIVVKKINKLNKRIEQLTEGKGMSEIDRTIVMLRDLIETCKNMKGLDLDGSNRVFIGQVHLERALEQLEHISIIVHGGNHGTV